MELSEATALAGTFITSLMFKAHSLPLDERTERAARWWREQGSRIPIRAAFEEKRRHMALFASRRSQRRNDREVYLEISAIVDDYGNGQCPALTRGSCGIYDRRPLTCRTVPLHYSRQPSALRDYIDRFTATPGYECDTTSSPIVISGSDVVSPDLRHYRECAIGVARADRRWKEHLLSFMDNPEEASCAGLPIYEEILTNTDNGYATLLPMIVGWRVAECRGLISSVDLENICKQQVGLIKTEMIRLPANNDLRELLPIYEAGAAGRGTLYGGPI